MASVDLTNHSPKRQIKHEISLPYLVENKGFTDGNMSPRGPRILVLDAPTSDEDRTNLEFYNSLFDAEVAHTNHHDDIIIHDV